MKNVWTALVLTVLVLFLAGCTTSSSGGTNRAFIGGTEGLRLSFLGSNPPDAVFDGGSTSFSISVKVENIGESDVLANDGYVRIQGLDPQTYNWVGDFVKLFPDQTLNGAQRNFDGSVLNGGVVTVDFTDLSYLPSVQGNLQQTVWADICYKYSTRTTTLLCIKRSADQVLGSKKICDVEGEKYPQNSGAPVQVSSVKENFAGNNRIGVTMVITHSGNGDNVFKDTATECNDVETNQDRGKVKILVHPIRIGGVDRFPVCSGLSEKLSDHEGYIRLFSDGSRQSFSLYCTIETGDVSSIFQIPLDVEMTYRYLDHLEKQINIRHAIA
jgi:hypothetical protein